MNNDKKEEECGYHFPFEYIVDVSLFSSFSFSWMCNAFLLPLIGVQADVFLTSENLLLGF